MNIFSIEIFGPLTIGIMLVFVFVTAVKEGGLEKAFLGVGIMFVGLGLIAGVFVGLVFLGICIIEGKTSLGEVAAYFTCGVMGIVFLVAVLKAIRKAHGKLQYNAKEWHEAVKIDEDLPVWTIHSGIVADKLQLLYIQDLFHIVKLLLAVRTGTDLLVGMLERVLDQLQTIEKQLQKFDEGTQRMFHPFSSFFKEVDFDLASVCQSGFIWENRPKCHDSCLDRDMDYSIMMWYNAVIEVFNSTLAMVMARAIHAQRDECLPEENRKELESDIAALRELAKRAKESHITKYVRIKDRDRTKDGQETGNFS